MKYLQPVMIRGAIYSASIGELCFLKFKVSKTKYQNVLEDYMIPSDENPCGDTELIFQQNLVTAYCQKH